MKIFFPFLLLSMTAWGGIIVSAGDNHLINCASALQLKPWTSKIISAEEKVLSTEEMRDETGVARNLKYTELKTAGGKEFLEKDIFTHPADLTFGIDVNGNTKGHMYIATSNGRFDGRMFWGPSTIEKGNPNLSNGLIIRYRKIPEKSKLALATYYAEGKPMHGPTCVYCGEELVFKVGGLGNDEKLHIFPHKFLKDLVLRGLKGEDGERLEPEIYTLNSDIHDFWNNLPRWKEVPKFIFKVALDPYTWQGARKRKSKSAQPEVEPQIQPEAPAPDSKAKSAGGPKPLN